MVIHICKNDQSKKFTSKDLIDIGIKIALLTLALNCF